jgi:hypothetical protein
VTDLTTDEFLEDEARRTAHLPPKPIPSAQGLPADVPDGRVDTDPTEAHPDVQEHAIVEEDPE